jgi:hypothetical protein
MRPRRLHLGWTAEPSPGVVNPGGGFPAAIAVPGLSVLILCACSSVEGSPRPSIGADFAPAPYLASNDEVIADSIRSTSAIIKIDTVRVDSVKLWYTRRDTVRIPIPVPSITAGMPFGSWDCTVPTDLGPFNLCIRSAGSWITSELAALKPLRAKLLLSQGGYAKFQRPDKTYDPAKYQAWVQTLKPYVASWQPYVTEGTLVGVQVIDDVGASNWGGTAISQARIDEMAKWWEELMPGLTTFVREKATGLAGYQWAYLDASISQYNAGHMGDVTRWRDSNVVAAKAARLGLMLSLNVLNGGKVVPGCYQGGSAATCSMTPAELLAYGAVEAAAPDACGLVSWKTSPAYQAQPGVAEAFRLLADIAALRSAPPCFVGPRQVP